MDLDSFPCGLCSLDESGRLVATNNTLMHIVCPDGGELVGKEMYDLLNPGSKVYFQLALWPALVLNGGMDDAELVLSTSDKVDKQVLFTARRRTSDMGVRYDCVLYPRKAHGTAEHRLLEIQRSVDQLPGSLFRLSRSPAGNYRLPYASPHLISSAGLEAATLFDDASPLLDAIHCDDRGTMFAALEQSAASSRFRPVTVRLNGAQGKLRWIRVHASVRTEPDGTVFWHGAVYDVTHQHLIDERLREVDKLQAVATLAAGVAHDFNNLLGSISGLAELCQADAEPGGVQHRNLSWIVLASSKAAQLVRQLLDFSRQAPAEIEVLSLAELMQRSGALLAASLPPRVRLLIDVVEDARVRVDAVQIEQCLLNLLANAAYAVREDGGTVRLCCDSVAVPDTDGAGPLPRLMARLSVSDDGEGIPVELQQKVFEPFFTTKPVGEGTGLGLAAVHGIVAGHGGFVDLESQPGHGTSVHILLPRHVADDEGIPHLTANAIPV